MSKQTAVQLPDDLADDAEAVARLRGDSVNQLIIDAFAAEIERRRADELWVTDIAQDPTMGVRKMVRRLNLVR
jgi:hypothetical protein